MKTENIEAMFQKDDHQSKLIVFFKNESEPKFKYDNQIPINSSIEFEDPMQISFLIGGEVRIRYSGGNKQEILGIMTYTKNTNLWQSLIASITERADAEIRRGCRIDIEFSDHHSFYVNGFKSKEDVIGTIQEKHKSWIKQIKRLMDQATPDPITDGDDQIEDKGIKNNKEGK